MDSCKKILTRFAWIVILAQLMLTTAFAATEFYVSPTGIKEKIHCDYLEIKDNRVECTAEGLIITYATTAISDIEVIYQGKSYNVQNFNQDARRKLNAINDKKKNPEKFSSTGNPEKTNNNSQKTTGLQIVKESFSSLTAKLQSLKNQYKPDDISAIASMVLLVIGVILSIVGSIYYIIVTFRIGILWGLSCLLLPFISLIFLFVHWKVAAKPFFISLLGTVFIIASVFILDGKGEAEVSTRPSATSTAKKQVKTKQNFTCSGKIYCSEMRSCAEAKFYIRNCPGTKMDGNNDGVPCEKQWCR